MRFTLAISALVVAYSPVALAASGGHHDAESAVEHAVDAMEHHAEHASGGLPQFNPESFTSQIFWLVIAFAILYLFFSKRTLPDISNIIANRQEHIQSDLDMAEELRAEAEEVHQAYEEALSDARNKASEHFVKAEEKIKAKTAKEMETFQERALADIKKTEDSIEKAKEAALEDLNSIAAQIASDAAAKIVGISPDIKQAKTVVESLNKKRAA